MKPGITKWGLLCCIAFMSISGIRAQTADDIIAKHIEAIGGKAKLSSIKSIYVESTTEVMGNEAPTITYILNGKAYRSETDFNGQKIIQCITDKGGWAINPMTGNTKPQVIPDEQLKGSKEQLKAGGPLFDYAARGSQVELQGKDTANGVNAYKIKLTTKDSSIVTYYIDPATYYIVRTVNRVSAGGQDVETRINFSNYQKTDFGYVIAMKQELILPQGLTLNITNKKVEINKDIDPGIFEMPKS